MTTEHEERRAAHARKGVLLVQAYADTYEWLNARLDDDGDGPIEYQDAVIVVPTSLGAAMNRVILDEGIEPGTWDAHRVAWALFDGLISGEAPESETVVVKRRGRFDPAEWSAIGSGHGVFLDRIRHLERLAAGEGAE